MKTLWLIAILLLLPALASAQAITSYTLVVSSGAGAVSTTVLPATSVTCNQTPLPTTNTVNPRHVQFTDPVNAGMACIYLDPGTGPLAALPFGATAYTATLTATNSAGTSPPSLASNSFTTPGQLPSAPVGVSIFR